MRPLAPISLLLLLVLPAVSFAQQEGRVKLPDFSDLARRATNSVVVTLDKDMLRTASQFIPKGGDSDAASAALSGLDGIYVRSFTFAHDHDYSPADVDSILEQLHGPVWSPMVAVHDARKNEDVHIYLCRDKGRTRGMVIVAAEPRELTIVNIVGDVDPAKLAQLGGRFGVPNIAPAHKGGS